MQPAIARTKSRSRVFLEGMMEIWWMKKKKGRSHGKRELVLFGKTAF